MEEESWVFEASGRTPQGAFLMTLDVLESGLPSVGVSKENNIIQCDWKGVSMWEVSYSSL